MKGELVFHNKKKNVRPPPSSSLVMVIKQVIQNDI